MRARDLAQYIYDKSKEMNIPLDNVRLQKLLYYVQGYSFKELLEPAFEDEFVHWENGPVIEGIYSDWKNDSFENYNRKYTISKPLEKLIIAMLKATESISSEELAQMTHQEDPWIMNADYIPFEDIKEYFIKHDPLGLSSYEALEYWLETGEDFEEFFERITTEDDELFKELAKL